MILQWLLLFFPLSVFTLWLSSSDVPNKDAACSADRSSPLVTSMLLLLRSAEKTRKKEKKRKTTASVFQDWLSGRQKFPAEEYMLWPSVGVGIAPPCFFQLCLQLYRAAACKWSERRLIEESSVNLSSLLFWLSKYHFLIAVSSPLSMKGDHFREKL